MMQELLCALSKRRAGSRPAGSPCHDHHEEHKGQHGDGVAGTEKTVGVVQALDRHLPSTSPHLFSRSLSCVVCLQQAMTCSSTSARWNRRQIRALNENTSGDEQGCKSGRGFRLVLDDVIDIDLGEARDWLRRRSRQTKPRSPTCSLSTRSAVFQKLQLLAT